MYTFMYRNRCIGSNIPYLIILAGTFPVVALMVGNAVTRISSGDVVCESTDNSTNSTSAESSGDPCHQSGCEVLAVDIAVTLSFLVGILMVSIYIR